MRGEFQMANLSVRRAIRRAGQGVVAGVLVLAFVGGQTSCGSHPREVPARRATSGVAPRDLERDERAGGHTLHRHVGLSDDELRVRLQRERRIAAASSYTDRATAERIVGETLDRSRNRIQAWLARAGARPNLVLDYRGDPGRPIGRSIGRGERSARVAFDAVVVLAWDGRQSYFVLTSYPEASR
ncbi:MAG: hypothetical protein A2Y78_04210 [Acidobacteria bacterium RBG_13_68_16]|jgi:hypothetical protein|nr:MAG: hypothetical protein A2Y78_04210 [Acidobacteria bacterium RBG_13_68_16]